MSSKVKSLSLATDLLAMKGYTQVEHHQNYFAQRTPDEPSFWFGNRVVFREFTNDANEMINVFNETFPSANHICLSWDVPDLSRDLVASQFGPLGFEVDREDVLTLASDPTPAVEPPGIRFAPIEVQRHWEQAEEIAFRDHIQQGYPEAGMRQFLRARTKTHQAQIKDGQGQWFGAFDVNILVASMGVFHDDHLIRFQSVQTRENYRRQGICAALLRHTLAWAQSRAPQATPVIVAMADSDAGRIYRRAGFKLTETLVSALKPPEVS